ncbi:MAG: aminodeoxychorismate synthase component I [Gemmatimonadota bacterium]|nr:aminodeoxychorismate synthase component I [Gemmatimonadota bacterium]
MRNGICGAMTDPLVRLDSHDPRRGGRSFCFGGLDEVVAASRVEEVIPALVRVEEAVSRGLHAAGYVAYEAAPAFDSALRTHPADPRLPLLWFAIFAEREEVPAVRHHPGDAERFSLGEWSPIPGEGAYRLAVEEIRELIAAGDSYQVNHTLRLRAPFRGSDLALYRTLCAAQGAAYGAFLRLGDLTVVSASPELFFRWTDGELELRPMKGTRPRGRWTAEDDALADELLTSPKERAENLMIVDLLRSDAGRVSCFGSVTVPRLFEVERYRTVHQLTSTVRSRTAPGTTLTDVFRALFPSGSVTGAPKVRTMGVIREMEETPRGIYTGAIGFVSPGEAEFSVAIRTLVVDTSAGRAELGVGSGITHDSNAAAEWEECLAKARFTRHTRGDVELLETLLHRPMQGYFLLDGHLARMEASARYFDLRYDEERVRAALARAVRGARSLLRVRLVLAVDGDVLVREEPLGNPPRSPLRVALSATPVDSRHALLYHKTTFREPYEARRREHPEHDAVLLVNERGEITEGDTANVVVMVAGELCTPPLEAGLLPGVFREHLLRAGTLRERTLLPADLHAAEEVYLVNSLRGWQRALLAE